MNKTIKNLLTKLRLNLWVLMCPIGAISGYFIGNELNTTLWGAVIGLTLGFILLKDKS